MTADQLCFGSRKAIRRTSVSPESPGAFAPQERKNPLPSPCVVILRETGMNRREVEFDLSTALDSGNANVLSLPAFRSLHDIELHSLAFLK
jgi:hypothetical protein